MATLARGDFEDCLAFLSGALTGPSGASEPEQGAAPQWTSPRLWHRAGRFGLRSQRVVRWFWNNVGTICAEQTVRVLEAGVAVGTLEVSYAERLLAGDRFVLDGRVLEFRRLVDSLVHTRPHGGEPSLPCWTSDRQSLSCELALALAEFRASAAQRLLESNGAGLRAWLVESFGISAAAAAILADLFEAQAQWSDVPGATDLLVEESPSTTGGGVVYTFHVPLPRAACEALARATAARLGRRFGRNLRVSIADLGWSIHITDDVPTALEPGDIARLFGLDGFVEDVLEGLDRGELPARRFRNVAATALMVLQNPSPGRRVRVGGLHWVSTRLYPLVKSACPEHPLLRETRREVLHDVLDVPAAIHWIGSQPRISFRSLPALSPFAAAWIEPGSAEVLAFEPAAQALKRLQSRLAQSAAAAG
jgi:ATP-dependent Lhr-like helicase